jgi:hypothetical protein
MLGILSFINKERKKEKEIASETVVNWHCSASRFLLFHLFLSLNKGKRRFLANDFLDDQSYSFSFN